MTDGLLGVEDGQATRWVEAQKQWLWSSNLRAVLAAIRAECPTGSAFKCGGLVDHQLSVS